MEFPNSNDKVRNVMLFELIANLTTKVNKFVIEKVHFDEEYFFKKN